MLTTHFNFGTVNLPEFHCTATSCASNDQEGINYLQAIASAIAQTAQRLSITSSVSWDRFGYYAIDADVMQVVQKIAATPFTLPSTASDDIKMFVDNLRTGSLTPSAIANNQHGLTAFQYLAGAATPGGTIRPLATTTPLLQRPAVLIGGGVALSVATLGLGFLLGGASKKCDQ